MTTDRRRSARAHARRVLFAAAVIGSGLFMLAARPGPAAAKPQFLTGFGAAYPAAAASPLNSCLLCHTTANPSDSNHRLNPYGYDWGERGDKDYRAIESLDSDGDGFTNLAEIQALTFPGDPASNPASVTTTTTLPGTPPDGAALYASACASCHGTGGGNLRGTGLTGGQFASIVSGGRPPSMPAYGASLTGTQIDAIYGYVTGAVPPPATTTTTTTTTLPGSPPPDGSALFASTCAGCHGAGGGNLVPTPLNSSQLVSVIGTGRGAMPGYAGSLSTAQIQALADYLISRSGATTTTGAPGVTTTAAAPRSGSAVYAASCAACHGTGGGDLVGTSLSHSQLVSVIAAGRGSMPGFGNRLPAAEIEALATYVVSLGTSGATATTTSAPGTTPNGSALYARSCAGCHGTTGEGGAGGPLAGTTLSRAQLTTVIAQGRGTMPAYASRLTAAEIDAIAAFVAGFGSRSGATTTTTGSGAALRTSTLYMQYCAGCHGPHGEGVAGVAPLDPSRLGRSEILSVITSGQGAMPGFGTQLSSADLGALADYVAVLGVQLDGPGDGASSTGGAGGTDHAATETTTTASAASGIGGDEAVAAGAVLPGAERPGWPWVPTVPLLAVVVGISLGAVRLWLRSLKRITSG